ncbi:transmembrane sensor/regulator PpyR [Pseudomonas sp. BN414]|uniref:transmembrane sensor/regulator PpyR n=1 Tax=Pseudomonas sp. BN414 TaxID=2567888 RepID=UPI002454F63C|nr:transmembrane sensor/regulator PpyR [Pseudomonas sp. BN414]MDH4566486.1 transmembrane sensor/regulator PpyR [Pseudomonas sp. BN414]
MFAFFESPQRVYLLGSQLLVSGSAMLVIGALLAYVFDAYLSMGCLVLAHLLTLLGPIAIKLGYVMRLHAQFRLS